MANLEYLHDIVKGLDGGKTLPPQAWLDRPLLPAQRAFLALPNKYKLFGGGIGSGKSYLGSLVALSNMRPGRDGLVVAPTYRMLSTVGQALILQHLNDNDCSYSFLKSEERLSYNGATTYFRSAERADLIRGLSVGWCWLDEGAMCGEALWRIILGRLRQLDPEAWITSTPQGFNWLYDYFVEAANPEYGHIQSATRENTYLPPEYLQSLEANYSSSFHDQELLGAFTSESGLVYPEFDRSIHVVEPFPIPVSWKKTAALDFGFYHPFATLWAAWDGDGAVYVYREYREAQKLLREHAAVLRSGDRVAYFISDHDSQDRRELYELGISTRSAHKDVVPGIQSVKARLKIQDNGEPRLYVFKSCPKLIREMGSYSWHQSQSLVSDSEKVKKLDDDLSDCLRYLSYFEDRANRRASFPPLAAIMGL